MLIPRRDVERTPRFAARPTSVNDGQGALPSRERPAFGGASSIIISRSTDGGNHWQTPVTARLDTSTQVLNDKESVTGDPLVANKRLRGLGQACLRQYLQHSTEVQQQGRRQARAAVCGDVRAAVITRSSRLPRKVRDEEIS
jgi:hypothetical protein